MTEWLRKNGSKILTTLGSIGLMGTVILAIKATPEAGDKILEAKIDKAEDVFKEKNEQPKGPVELPKLTVIETVKACGKCYIPTAATLLATLACFWGAEIHNEKQNAALTAAYATLVESFQLWRRKTGELVGEDYEEMALRNAEKEVEDAKDGNPPWDERQAFSVDGVGKIFETTMEQVIMAEYAFNRLFVLRGYATVNDFLEILRQPKIRGGDDMGWDAESGEVWYGYHWVDFAHKHTVLDDGFRVCMIEFPFAPHPMFEAAEEEIKMLEEHSK